MRRLPWSRTPYYDGERAGECNVIQHFTSYITQSVSQVLVKTDQGCLKKDKFRLYRHYWMLGEALDTVSVSQVLIMTVMGIYSLRHRPK